MLPKLPKKDPRPIALTVRLSKQAVASLKMLADEHNMSQADVIEHLIKNAVSDFNKDKKGKRE